MATAYEVYAGKDKMGTRNTQDAARKFADKLKGEGHTDVYVKERKIVHAPTQDKMHQSDHWFYAKKKR